ncbi:MAG: late competence development ComFB family protein [Steroidobacteraceae bacterium]|nr:late competence development ComFB family protein [Steroidobacteraceae bacterium]
MTANFATVHNFHESTVYEAVLRAAVNYPMIASSPDLLADVACVALNALPPRYIRHAVDMRFYLSNDERAKIDQLVRKAVLSAFEFVQSRTLAKASA